MFKSEISTVEAEIVVDCSCRPGGKEGEKRGERGGMGGEGERGRGSFMSVQPSERSKAPLE